MNKDFSKKRKQALKDWKYIQSNYGFCQSHDYDDKRMWKLLENNLRQLPLTDKKIVPIKKRLIYGKEL